MVTSLLPYYVVAQKVSGILGIYELSFQCLLSNYKNSGFNTVSAVRFWIIYYLLTSDTMSIDSRAEDNHSLVWDIAGETKRKYESVYTGGTMDTVGGGEITQYWHCCGRNDPFDPGCEAAPHSTYDD